MELVLHVFPATHDCSVWYFPVEINFVLLVGALPKLVYSKFEYWYSIRAEGNYVSCHVTADVWLGQVLVYICLHSYLKSGALKGLPNDRITTIWITATTLASALDSVARPALPMSPASQSATKDCMLESWSTTISSSRADGWDCVGRVLQTGVFLTWAYRRGHLKCRDICSGGRSSLFL